MKVENTTQALDELNYAVIDFRSKIGIINADRSIIPKIIPFIPIFKTTILLCYNKEKARRNNMAKNNINTATRYFTQKNRDKLESVLFAGGVVEIIVCIG